MIVTVMVKTIVHLDSRLSELLGRGGEWVLRPKQLQGAESAVTRFARPVYIYIYVDDL